MHAQFLRIKKLTGKAIIEVAARHNHREILAELGASPDGHIDPTRVELNCILHGHSTAAAVAGEAQSLMDAAGVRSLRKDAVRGIEVIFSLPPESSVDHDRFFNDSVQWAGQYFDAPVISAIVHNDESAPHCHVLLLPLVNGRMIGSELVGGRAKLQALQADFQAQVGQRYGLARQTAQKCLSAATRKRAIDLAFDVLEANSGLSNAVLLALLAPHTSNPAPLLLALGIAIPTSPAKESFVAMMTKPCKPEKPIGFGKKKPIRFDGSAAPEKEQTLSCVGFAEITPSDPPPNEPTSVNQGTTVNPQPTSASTASTTSTRRDWPGSPARSAHPGRHDCEHHSGPAPPARPSAPTPAMRHAPRRRWKTPEGRAPPVPHTPLLIRTALFGYNLKEPHMAEQPQNAPALLAALLRRQEVEVIVGFARSAIHRRVAAGTFPRPIKLGRFCVRWRREDIEEWLADPTGYRAPTAQEAA